MNNRNCLGLPVALSIIISLLASSCIIVFIVTICKLNPSIVSAIMSISIILTLIVLIYYAYYTYLIWQEPLMPCASFKMEMPNNHSYFVRFIIKNHSKVSIQCWCKLNASVNGISIEMPGFYNGQTPFDIQPFGEVGGFFSLGDIMSKAGENATSLVQKKTNDNLKELLYMDIEFWYNKIGEDRIIENPKQPHYYNFATNQLVTDF